MSGKKYHGFFPDTGTGNFGSGTGSSGSGSDSSRSGSDRSEGASGPSPSRIRVPSESGSNSGSSRPTSVSGSKGHFVNTMKPEMTGSEIPPDSTVENSKKTSSSAESGEISHIEKVIQRSMEKVFDRKIKTLEKNMDARFDILQKVIKISYQNLPKK